MLHIIKRRYASKWLVLIFDVGIVLITLFLAYLIRSNFQLNFNLGIVLKQLPFVAIAAIFSFLLVKSHKGVVRYTGFKDLVNIIIGTNILATILLLATYGVRKFNLDTAYELSGSIIYIHLLLNILALVGIKFFVKSFYRSLISDFQDPTKVIIYGAGNSGMITYDAIQSDTRSSFEIIGFIDDNPKMIGKKINLLNVYSLDQVDQEFIDKHELQEIIISIQNIDPSRLLEITTQLFNYNLKVKIVPPVKNWIGGDLNVQQIKAVKIEDLLGREQIIIKNPVVEEEYSNQIILVTGAAGSIGSEIARKLMQLNPKSLILLDAAESPLYDLQQEFMRKGLSNFIPEIANVRDNDRMEQIFDKYKPKIVFHAAAYKHVPLMEGIPYEAVRVNIGGTKCVADLAVEYGVNKFVLISTDKAVNPTNVMGASKRIAELYVSCLKGKGRTKFITTRFGNVLGSSGSVIPLFQKQIELGGPITVTHRDITRYFMTISEAAQLVLEAATMGNGGEIFVFDMGKPVKIFDLARNMIFLSGKTYPDDIQIKITGLRPGEKIYEELLADGENSMATYNEKILIARTKPTDNKTTKDLIDEISNINISSQPVEIVALIKKIVPEYISNNSKYELLDQSKKL
ncbi:MAG: polysaccharide biosynthesis protein [Flavobacteriaceae bacterium]|nr:polysaccharide biosynthesis protein [Bacteroidia bacterium]NNK87408.1 polysaccharide biosynthesis protein [Flavobacteriaceae bacterium]